MFISTSKLKTYLLLEIGSAQVSASLVVHSEGESPTVVWHTQEPLPLGDAEDHSQLFHSLPKTVAHILTKAQSNGERALEKHNARTTPERIIAIFAPPWYAANAITVDQHFNETHEISAKYIDSVREHMLEEFADHASKEFPKQFQDSKADICEAAYISTALNGYKTDNPAGQKAQSFGASIYVSAVPEEVSAALEEAVDTVYSASLLEVHTHPFVTYTTLHHIFRTLSNTLILTVGGEVTELVVISDGSIRAVTSFAVGENDIVRAVATELNIGIEAARSQLALNGAETLDDTHQKRLTKVIKKIADKWDRKLKATIDTLGQEHALAGSAVIHARGDIGAVFHDILLYKGRKAGTQVPRRIVEIDHEHLDPHVTFAESAPFDTFVAVNASFVAYK